MRFFVLQISLISLQMDWPTAGCVKGRAEGGAICYATSNNTYYAVKYTPKPALYLHPHCFFSIPVLCLVLITASAWREEHKVFCLTVWSALLSAWLLVTVSFGTMVCTAIPLGPFPGPHTTVLGTWETPGVHICGKIMNVNVYVLVLGSETSTDYSIGERRL